MGIHFVFLGKPYYYLLAFGGILFIFVPGLVFRLMRLKPVHQVFFFAYLFFLFAYTGGLVLSGYAKLSQYDTVMHFLSGILTSFLSLVLLYYLKPGRQVEPKDAGLAVTYSLFTSLAVAGLWEIAEFFYGMMTGMDPQNVLTTGVTDTMVDMIVCTLGALLFVISILLYYRKDRMTPLMAAFDAFVHINLPPQERPCVRREAVE